jgi:alkylhydroperoxidase family enzyme
MTMSDSLSDLQQQTRRSVIDGPGLVAPAVRQQVAAGEPPDELRILVRKIHDGAYRVTDADVDRLRQTYTEDQLFELILAAAIGAAELRLKAAVAAIDGDV